VNVVLPSTVIKAPTISNIAQLVNKKNGKIIETVNNFSGTSLIIIPHQGWKERINDLLRLRNSD